jgi:hypothetical protein
MTKTKRTVTSIAKDSNGKITALYGSQWRVSVEDATRQILDGEYEYRSRTADGPRVLVYLRTAADSSTSNNLENLPDR